LKGAEREAVLAVKKGKGKSGRCFGGL